MTRLDDRLVPKVYSIINRLGADASVAVESKDRSAVSSTATVDFNAVAGSPFSIKVAPLFDAKVVLQEGSHVRLGECRTIVPAQGLQFDPERAMTDQRHTYTINGIDWRPVGAPGGIEAIRTGELIAAYEVHLVRVS